MMSEVPSEATTRIAKDKRTILTSLETALEEFRSVEESLNLNKPE